MGSGNAVPSGINGSEFPSANLKSSHSKLATLQYHVGEGVTHISDGSMHLRVACVVEVPILLFTRAFRSVVELLVSFTNRYGRREISIVVSVGTINLGAEFPVPGTSLAT